MSTAGLAAARCTAICMPIRARQCAPRWATPSAGLRAVCCAERRRRHCACPRRANGGADEISIAGLDGRLFPLGWLRLIWRLKVKGVRSGRMPLMGIAKRFQGTAKGAAVALSMIERIRSRYSSLGYRHAELSWILEDNKAVQAVIGATPAVPYKRYRIYAKALA